MKWLALVGASLALAACSSGPSWNVYRGHGVSVRYPPGWFATGRPLTPVTDPVQVLAVASYPLPRGGAGCSPKAALERLPRDGTFLFGWEFRMPSPSGLKPADFPARPSHFELSRLTTTECLGRSYQLRFRDAGRFFQLHVVLGADASARTALRVVDSFRAGTRGR